ncbi:peptide/nickel transport system substrate-binding protein [Mesorhizobium albiziae]|uniref:Peptide/nickel transport system substrate-binding protein n=1 Tax=Neomesorhizobium albiziae TaxID=335020 RepID=A0A1I4B2R7_9HYPH|nr:ABC transporter substrate-binding protein [Mesorhizobium albiziae]GLS34258.1 peptide ABC transporter substrate-binding protein [Mesorhizobium albiziae]SFK62670.1 peptide/nickel transport system substrate-binding protein [Mesorhizobium albiziae]
MSNELDYLSHHVASGRLSRRDFLGRAAALGVSATFANTLISGAARAQGPVKGGLLKAGMVGGAATDSLDPATWASQVPYTFGRCWGEQMLEISPTGDIEPRLAEEYTASDDAKTWTFKIRKGVTFHNGKELTPQDIVATLERHADANSKSAALPFLQEFDSIKVDGGNVVITLKESNADLPYVVADYHLMIQPNGGKDDPTAGIGTGPYKMVINEPGVRHVGELQKGYWGSDLRGHADQIEIVVINDATARTGALQSGQVSMINRVEPKIVDLIKNVPGVTIRNVAGKGHYVFIAHCNTAPFDNNDLRLALKYAVDRQDMVDKILRGYGSIGNDMPVTKAYPLFAEDIEQRAFDPDKAAFHYKKSGHSGPVVLRTSDVAFPGALDAAQLYQQSAAKAGITLEVKREPGDGYWSEVWNKQPFSMSYWTGRPTQDQVYSIAYLSKAEWNDTRFQRSDFDKLILDARKELDQAKRRELYRAAGVMLRDEGGVIVPMFNDYIDATNDKVGGWVDNPNSELMGGHALTKCWVVA